MSELYPDNGSDNSVRAAYASDIWRDQPNILHIQFSYICMKYFIFCIGLL